MPYETDLIIPALQTQQRKLKYMNWKGGRSRFDPIQVCIWRPSSFQDTSLPFSLSGLLWKSVWMPRWGSDQQHRETVVWSKSCFVEINLWVHKREEGVEVWNPIRIAVGMAERERAVIVGQQLQKYPEEGREEESNTQNPCWPEWWLPLKLRKKKE